MAKNVKCEFCSEICNSKKDYFRHSNQIHRTNIRFTWFKCQECSLFYPKFRGLREHTKIVHKRQIGQQIEPNCQFCDKTFTRLSSLYTHCNRVHRREVSKKWCQCLACNLCLPDVVTLRYHVTQAHKAPTKRKCDFCWIDCKSNVNFRIHANIDHKEQVAKTWFKCDNCDVYLPTEKSLTAHQGATGHRKLAHNYQCLFCPKRFDDLKRYHKHSNLRHKDKISNTWISCTRCNSYFVNQRTFNRHRCGRARITSKTCFHCVPDKKHETKEEYYEHINKEHPEEVGPDWHKCHKCNFSYPRLQSHLKRTHGKSEKKKRKCSFCDRHFRHSSDYVEHCNQTHLESLLKKWVVCQDCKLFFPSENCVALHRCQSLKKSAENSTKLMDSSSSVVENENSD